MNKEIGNIAGVRIMVNPETYEDIKKQKTIYENEILFELQTRIDKATKCIKDFLCTKEYNKVDGKAIADNYMEVLNILGGSDE